MKSRSKALFLGIVTGLLGSLLGAGPAAAVPNNYGVTKFVEAFGTVINVSGVDMGSATHYSITPAVQGPNFTLRFPITDVLSGTEIQITLPTFAQIQSYLAGFTGNRSYLFQVYTDPDSSSPTNETFSIFLYKPYADESGGVECSTDGYFLIDSNVVTENGGCTGEAQIPNGVTSIGPTAFKNTPGLTSVTIPNSVTSLGSEAFADTLTLTSASLGNSLVTIGDDAFNGTGLTAIIIPDSVTTIGTYGFANISTLTSISFGNSLTTIGDSAFYNSGITSLVIPDSVTFIGDYAFMDSQALTSVFFGNSLATIGESAFQFSGIQDLFIPDSVTTIRDSAFADSISLNRVQIGSGVVSYGISVFDRTNLAEHQDSTETQTVYYCGSNSSFQNYVYDAKNGGPSCGDPDGPSLDQVQVLGENSVRLSFTAPMFTGAGVVTQYEVSVRDPSGATVLETQLFTPSPAVARGASSTLTVVGLIRGTTYAFSLKSIKIANSVEYGSYQSNSLTATTSSPNVSGGTAADELRRQQEAAAAAKQKQDQELREILSLVPTIAGLAQGVAGLGNSLLLPKKCVKGKLVKNVKAGAKCPKGYKARK
jgi:hypothetical protein